MARVFRITDATTRLLSDGELEDWSSSSALTNWTATGSPTVARSTSNVMEGVYSARIRNTSTQAVRGVYQDVTNEIVSGDVYYVRCWVYVAAGTVRLYAWDGGGTSNAEYAESSGTGWQQLIVKKTAVSTGIRVGLVAYSASSDGYFDLVQIATGHIEFIEGVEDTTFRITNWRQNLPVEKGGGIFQDSPIADGRELIDSYWSNTQDTIEFNVIGISTETQDTIIAKWRELLQLIQKANSYGKTTWQHDPVYCEAKALNETNYRYSRIIYANIPDAEDMFHITFLQLVMVGIQLNIEHGHWTALPPGHGVGVAISAVEAYNSVNYGNVDSNEDREPTALNEVFFTNKRNTANITNVHLGTGGSNRIGAALPHAIIAATGSTYFGIDTSIADSGPFFSLVFDIGTAGAGSPTLVWEEWDGVSWSALTLVNDGTNGFTNVGVNIITWQALNLKTTSPGGGLPTGFWIRVRVSSGSFSTQPTQQNRNVYSVVWPYIEIQASEIGGDIPAITNAILKSGIVGVTSVSSANRVMMGARSVNRGDGFTAYLNLSDEQNPAGVTVANEVSSEGSFIDLEISPTGRIFRYNPTGAVSSFSDVVSVTLDSTIASDFAGRFRAFVVLDQRGGSDGDFTIRLDAFDGSNIAFYQSDEIVLSPISTSAENNIFDIGELSIPSEIGVDIESVKFVFYATNTNATPGDIYFLHLILIPADEYVLDTSSPDTSSSSGRLGNFDYLFLNTLNNKSTRSVLLDTVNDTLSNRWRHLSSNQLPILQNKTKLRLWFTTILKATNGRLEADFWNTFSIQLKHLGRYLSMRGDG